MEWCDSAGSDTDPWTDALCCRLGADSDGVIVFSSSLFFCS